jgi:predicted site-specific integrase-resolvase
VSRVFGDFSRDVANKKKICYARLSSNHLREKNQVGILDKLYPGTEIIKDIGSGLNFKKKDLYPFWTESIQEKSKKLLSCTTTDCEDLVLSSWNHLQKGCLQDRGSQ